MSAYYNIIISKGIKNLEDLLNSNKKVKIKLTFTYYNWLMKLIVGHVVLFIEILTLNLFSLFVKKIDNLKISECDTKKLWSSIQETKQKQQQNDLTSSKKPRNQENNDFIEISKYQITYK